MVCTKGTVDILPVLVFFVSNNILSTLCQYVLSSDTVDIQSVIVFVSINIVSTLGQYGVYLRYT